MHGNYLRSSIVAAGLDPDALAAGNMDAMKFGSEGSSKSKAWRDIWGSGQGVGAVDRVVPAAELIARLAERICRRQSADLRLARSFRACRANRRGSATGRRLCAIDDDMDEFALRRGSVAPAPNTPMR